MRTGLCRARRRSARSALTRARDPSRHNAHRSPSESGGWIPRFPDRRWCRIPRRAPSLSSRMSETHRGPFFADPEPDCGRSRRRWMGRILIPICEFGHALQPPASLIVRANMIESASCRVSVPALSPAREPARSSRPSWLGQPLSREQPRGHRSGLAGRG
jgi:hypothetical protein